MVRDPLVQQAWEIRRRTAHFSLDVILTATIWLEHHHRRTLDPRTAIALALQYLVLAMRHELHDCPSIVENYLFRAVRWREEANRWMGEPGTLTTPQSRN